MTNPIPIPQDATIGEPQNAQSQNSPNLQSVSIPPDATVQNEGEVINDVGNKVIVPKDGESFADTMHRAANQGKVTTQAEIDKELATAPKKVAQVAIATPAISVGLPALEAGIPEAIRPLYEAAVRHLAGNVLPELEEQAAKQKLLEIAPKVAKFVRDLGIGAIGTNEIWKLIAADSKRR